MSYSPFIARQIPRVSMALTFLGSIFSARDAYPAAALMLPWILMTYAASALASAVFSLRHPRTYLEASLSLPASMSVDA